MTAERERSSPHLTARLCPVAVASENFAHDLAGEPQPRTPTLQGVDVLHGVRKLELSAFRLFLTSLSGLRPFRPSPGASSGGTTTYRRSGTPARTVRPGRPHPSRTPRHPKSTCADESRCLSMSPLCRRRRSPRRAHTQPPPPCWRRRDSTRTKTARQAWARASVTVRWELTRSPLRRRLQTSRRRK